MIRLVLIMLTAIAMGSPQAYAASLKDDAAASVSGDKIKEDITETFYESHGQKTRMVVAKLSPVKDSDNLKLEIKVYKDNNASNAGCNECVAWTMPAETANYREFSVEGKTVTSKEDLVKLAKEKIKGNSELLAAIAPDTPADKPYEPTKKDIELIKQCRAKISDDKKSLVKFEGDATEVLKMCVQTKDWATKLKYLLSKNKDLYNELMKDLASSYLEQVGLDDEDSEENELSVQLVKLLASKATGKTKKKAKQIVAMGNAKELAEKLQNHREKLQEKDRQFNDYVAQMHDERLSPRTRQRARDRAADVMEEMRMLDNKFRRSVRKERSTIKAALGEDGRKVDDDLFGNDINVDLAQTMDEAREGFVDQINDSMADAQQGLIKSDQQIRDRWRNPNDRSRSSRDILANGSIFPQTMFRTDAYGNPIPNQQFTRGYNVISNPENVFPYIDIERLFAGRQLDSGPLVNRRLGQLLNETNFTDGNSLVTGRPRTTVVPSGAPRSGSTGGLDTNLMSTLGSGGRGRGTR